MEYLNTQIGFCIYFSFVLKDSYNLHTPSNPSTTQSSCLEYWSCNTGEHRDKGNRCSSLEKVEKRDWQKTSLFWEWSNNGEKDDFHSKLNRKRVIQSINCGGTPTFIINFPEWIPSKRSFFRGRKLSNLLLEGKGCQLALNSIIVVLPVKWFEKVNWC